MGWIVRRLMPVECERLQGFPDGYTDIGGKVKRNKDGSTFLVQSETPDSPRYKALGNSMAVPVMKWIGERIGAVDSSDLSFAEDEERDDGIGYVAYAIMDEITLFCSTECPSYQCCPEDECVLFRIENLTESALGGEH